MATISLDYEQVLRWFNTYDHADQSQVPSSQTTQMGDEFIKIYKDANLTLDKTKDTCMQMIMLHKYQSQWENMFRQGVVCLPPIPEDYYVKLWVSLILDRSMFVQFDKYSLPHMDSKYFNRARMESARLGALEGAFGDQTHAISDELQSLAVVQMSRELIDLGIEKSLLEMVEESEPRSLAEVYGWLNQEKGVLYIDGKYRAALICLYFVKSIHYLTWNDEQKKVMDEFFRHPVNARLMADWEIREENAAKRNEENPLTFPTGYPNGLSEAEMKTYARFYKTPMFGRITGMIESLGLPFEDPENHF